MGAITIDPQAIGYEDDGTESGLLRVKPTRGDLVRVPARPGLYQAELGTAGTVTYQQSGITDNEDGTGTGLNLSVPAGLNNGVRIWVPFSGSVFGVRFRRDVTATLADFTVLIDGVPYPITAKDTRMLAEGMTTASYSAHLLVAENLPFGPHLAEIVMDSNATTTNTLLMHGWLLSRMAGYGESRRLAQVISTTTLTTTLAILQSATSVYTAIRSIWYTNTTVSPVTVTIANNAVTIRQVTVPANGDAVVDFPDWMALNTLIQHKASAATSVNATLFGGF